MVLKQYLCKMMDEERMVSRRDILIHDVLVLLEQTISDFAKSKGKLLPYVANSTLNEISKLLKDSRKYFRSVFCAKMNQVCDDSAFLSTLPFVVRYKIASEAPMSIFVDECELALLKGLCLVDDAMNTFRFNILL